MQLWRLIYTIGILIAISLLTSSLRASVWGGGGEGPWYTRRKVGVHCF